MPGSVTLTIKLFGAFRAIALNGPVAISLPKGAGLPEVRTALKNALGDTRNAGLVDESAFADERQILPEHTLFEKDIELALLPPVCGG